MGAKQGMVLCDDDCLALAQPVLVDLIVRVIDPKSRGVIFKLNAYLAGAPIPAACF